MTFDIIAAVDTIINNFDNTNVTGCSGKPVRKYPDDTDLHSLPERQDNGCIKFTQADLLAKDKDGFNSTTENYLLFGHTYLDVSITAMEFLSEINRLFNVNNQSIARTAEYIFTWKNLHFTGAGLQYFSLTLEVEKYFVEDNLT